MKNAKEIAAQIASQIGQKAFFMLGAQNMVYGEENGMAYLSFRIRGSSRVNYVKVSYNAGLDLYIVEFGKIRGVNYRVVSQFENVYADGLHKLIEQESGLYVKLF